MLATQSDFVAVEDAQAVERALGKESGSFGWSSVCHKLHDMSHIASQAFFSLTETMSPLFSGLELR